VAGFTIRIGGTLFYGPSELAELLKLLPQAA
jgi:hypothetical protein